MILTMYLSCPLLNFSGLNNVVVILKEECAAETTSKFLL